MPWRSNRWQRRFSLVTAVPHCLLHAGRSGPSPSSTPGLREVLDFAELEENNDSRINGITLKTFEIKPSKLLAPRKPLVVVE